MSKSKRIEEIKQELVNSFDEEQLLLHQQLVFLESEQDYLTESTGESV